MIDLDAKVKPTALSLRLITESMNGKDDRWDELCATKTLKDVQFSMVPTVENIKRLMGEAAMMDERMRAEIESFATDLVAFHNKEVRFYEEIGIQVRHVSLPKIYKAQGCDSVDDLQSAFLLMEDLSPKGGLADVKRGLSKEQVVEVIKVIAEFHAYSFTFPKQLVEDLPLPTFGEHKEKTADNHGDTLMNKLLGLPLDYFKNHEKALRKIVTSVKLGDDLNLHKKFGVPPVLCHGDLWVNNIFFKKGHNGSITDEVYAFLDWQLAHPNTGLTDICRLLLLGVNAGLKLRYTDDWLCLYFDTFEESTKRYGVDCPYTLELVRKMFYAHYTPQLIFAAFLLSHMSEKEEDEKVRTILCDRIISGFEEVRGNYE